MKTNAKEVVVSGVSLLVVFFFSALTAEAGMGERFPVAGQSTNEGCVSAAFDGTNILAGIQNGHGVISCQLLDLNGSLVGSRTYLDEFGGAPQVSFGGGTYLLSWESEYADSPIYGQLVTPASETNGPAFQISFSPGRTSPSDLTRVPFGDGKFLVTWQDYRYANETNGNSAVYGRLVSTNGTLAGSEIPIATTASAAPGVSDRDSSAAFDGSNFLVVFSTTRRSGTGYGEDIYGQFVSPSGTLVSGNFVIDQNDLPSDNPTAVCWDGEKYTVLFNDQTVVDYDEDGPVGPRGIYARFVSPSGVVATNRIAIAASPTDSEQFPTIAFDGSHYLISLTCMQGISTNFPIGTNLVSRGRFYDKELVPTTPWFTLAEKPASSMELPISLTLATGDRFTVGMTYLDPMNFEFLRTDAVIADSTPPRIGSLSIQNDAVTLGFENMFLGTTNYVEWTDSLTSTNGWQTADAFICGSSTTNWSAALEGRPQGFVQLKME